MYLLGVLVIFGGKLTWESTGWDAVNIGAPDGYYMPSLEGIAPSVGCCFLFICTVQST